MPAKKKAKGLKKKIKPKAQPAKPKRKPPEKFMKLLAQKFTPSEALAKVIGADPVTRAQAVKKMWQYIKSHNLQQGRNITADENLKPLAWNKDTFTMFEVAKILKEHLTPATTATPAPPG